MDSYVLLREGQVQAQAKGQARFHRLVGQPLHHFAPLRRQACNLKLCIPLSIATKHYQALHASFCVSIQLQYVVTLTGSVARHCVLCAGPQPVIQLMYVFDMLRGMPLRAFHRTTIFGDPCILPFTAFGVDYYDCLGADPVSGAAGLCMDRSVRSSGAARYRHLTINTVVLCIQHGR
jgi:hypothetical protein